MKRADLFIIPTKGSKMRPADTLDQEWLADRVEDGTYPKFIVNDEKLSNGATLLTVTQQAWRELESLA